MSCVTVAGSGKTNRSQLITYLFSFVLLSLFIEKTFYTSNSRYSVDDVKPKKRTEYRRSELRLLESMENVCDRVLEYNIHKERKDSTRFAKGMSQTFQTLHGLVDKGVKVDLGIPYELWDKPSAEITQMKTQCETMVENFEDVIEKWYFNKQEEIPLIKYLCEDRVLKSNDHQCLYEKLEAKADEGDADDKKDQKEEL